MGVGEGTARMGMEIKDTGVFKKTKSKQNPENPHVWKWLVVMST
jgi:hypothetical protein